MNEKQFFIARQSIYDQHLGVFGYELLFRNGDTAQANIIDGNEATSQLIDNSFAELGIQNVTQNKPAFINLTRDYLVGRLALPITTKNVVLEILEDIEADNESIAALKRLAQQGFTIALDDFSLNSNNRELIPYASIIKMDILHLSEEELRQQVKELRNYPVKLLAEKVESKAELELCEELGFDYYQGYFLSKPKIISGISTR